MGFRVLGFGFLCRKLGGSGDLVSTVISKVTIVIWALEYHTLILFGDLLLQGNPL